ncbi:MAG: amidinotransferase [Methylotenera sp.]|nr:amidinotransferase [Oligoflexia bacterium]
MSDVSCSLPHAHSEQCHFQIAWTINPHMVPGSSDLEIAFTQHLNFKQLLRDAGAEVVELPFVCSAYDSVFTKDNALLLSSAGPASSVKPGASQLAVLANPLHGVRRAEQAGRKKALLSRGFSVVELPPQFKLEGGDLVVCAGHGIFMGHGFRSTLESAHALEVRIGVSVLPLKLVDPFLYHLDTALSVLKDGTAIACKRAFAPKSWELLVRSPWISKVIEVSEREALSFGCNLVQVGKTVILGSFLPGLMRSLKLQGYTPRYAPLSEFQRAGGSAACLVAEVHDHEALRSHAAGERSHATRESGLAGHTETLGLVTTSPTAARRSTSEYA